MNKQEFETLVQEVLAPRNLQTVKTQAIYDNIVWAWENWEDVIVDTYFQGEKPEAPTEEFVRMWLENEPMENLV